MHTRSNSRPICAVLLALLALAGASAGGEAKAPMQPPNIARPVASAQAVQVGTLPGVGAPPSPVVAARNFESRPLAFPQPAQRQDRQAARSSYSLPSILPAFFYVALICGLFLAILHFTKKYIPGHKRLFSHPSMEVLGRAHIDQRRYVSLLRVGKRIIVVGVSQDEMRALSEITDEVEITGIMEVARPRTEAGLTIFQRLFQRNVLDADKEVERHDLAIKAEEKARELEDNLSSLRERVRSIRERETPARHIDSLG